MGRLAGSARCSQHCRYCRRCSHGDTPAVPPIREQGSATIYKGKLGLGMNYSHVVSLWHGGCIQLCLEVTVGCCSKL